MKKRIALAFGLLTAVSVAILTLLAFLQSQSALHASMLRESAASLDKTSLQIGLILEEIKKDVLFLASTTQIRGMARAAQLGGYDHETRSSYNKLAEDFQQLMVSLVRSKPGYWQARYIDEYGQEQVRVENINGDIRPVTKSDLQNKAHSSYFQETMKLGPGNLYVSPLDLNREHGKGMSPPRATLRVATPIIDRRSERRGIIIINMNAEGLLAKLQGPAQTLGGQGYMVDQDGYFLAHPDPDKTFGFDRGFDYRLQQLHPSLWEKMKSVNNFVEHQDSEELPGLEKHVHGFDKIAYDPNNPANYWAVVFEIPDSVVFAPVLVLRDNLLASGVLIAVLGGLAGMFWAGRFSRQAIDLSALAEEIARGHTDLRVDISTKSHEFKLLGQAFNRMLDELTTSERRFSNMINLAADAIIAVDESQTIRTFNKGAERIFGYAAWEILGQPLDMLLPPDVIRAHREHLRHFIAGPEVSRAMNRRTGTRGGIQGRRKDGSEFPAEASISKIEDNGKLHLTVFLRDISEREQAQQALKEKDRLLTMMGGMAKVGGWEFDVRTLKITWTDEVAKIHSMNPKDEISLEKVLQFYPGESRGIIERAMKDAVEKAAHFDEELRLVTHKGERKWVRSIGQPVMENGVVVMLRGSFQDITELKNVEAQILSLNAELERKVHERTAELVAANQELETFSYSVSHDLRAPLRAIDGFSQAVIEDWADRLDEQAKDYLNRVRAATQRMGRLIDDILSLAHVSRAELQRDTVDLSALAADVLAELQKSEPQRKVHCTIQPGMVALGDTRLLRMALVNLLGNAWKYTGQQAHPRIEFGRLHNASPNPEFYVRDNGAGFDMAYAGKLFGAFQRLHLTSEFPGTGVGLATVQRIINRHGGYIRGEGTPGESAVFYFTLPAETFSVVTEAVHVKQNHTAH